MKREIRRLKARKKHNYKKCGAVSCINNIHGLCDNDKCDLYENLLIQED